MKDIYLDDRICKIGADFDIAYSTIKLIQQTTLDSTEEYIQYLSFDLNIALAECSDAVQIISDMWSQEMGAFSFSKAFIANKQISALKNELAYIITKREQVQENESQLYRKQVTALNGLLRSLSKIIKCFDDLIINQPQKSAA